MLGIYQSLKQVGVGWVEEREVHGDKFYIPILYGAR